MEEVQTGVETHEHQEASPIYFPWWRGYRNIELLKRININFEFVCKGDE
jgi:hypothetical protein